jgi:hypothetical protein
MGLEQIDPQSIALKTNYKRDSSSRRVGFADFLRSGRTAIAPFGSQNTYTQPWARKEFSTVGSASEVLSTAEAICTREKYAEGYRLA